MTNNKNCSEHISSMLQAYLKELDYRIQHEGKPLGLSTGINALDKLLGGIRSGELILFGARPAMGKTSFAINLSYKLAKSFLKEKEKNPDSNKSVLWFSMETPCLYMLQRLVATKIEDVWPFQLARYEYGTKSYEEFKKIADIGKEIEQLPIYICDDIELTLDDIKNKIKEISHYSTVSFVVIDYLTLINREEFSYEGVLQKLKNIAKEFNIPIFILSQLTRDVENRKYKIPHLGDIRQFKKHGFIDKILFLYREYYYLHWHEPQKLSKESEQHFKQKHTEWKRECKAQENVAQIIIAKNNSGGIGHVKCFCDLKKCEFDDLPDQEFLTY